VFVFVLGYYTAMEMLLQLHATKILFRFMGNDVSVTDKLPVLCRQRVGSVAIGFDRHNKPAIVNPIIKKHSHHTA
jgi:hypothetical protein